VKSAWSALFLIALLLGPFGAARGAEYYGVDSGGSRYAEVAQINAGNVDRLVTAWTYRTGDLARRYAAVALRSEDRDGLPAGQSVHLPRRRLLARLRWRGGTLRDARPDRDQ
jgi:hypothetical protein